MTWLASAGASIAIPVGNNPSWDLIADFYGCVVRVQVKTSRQYRNGRWEVTICTRGGNRSWNGVVKRLDPRGYDYLFATVADGRQWFIPARVIEGGSGLILGGPKYELYEVERGAPMPLEPKLPAALRIAS